MFLPSDKCSDCGCCALYDVPYETGTECYELANIDGYDGCSGITWIEVLP